MIDLFNNGTGQTYIPGQKIPRVRGYSEAEKYNLPRDCEAIFLDAEEDYCYIKKVDQNGSERVLMAAVKLVDPPKFDPKKYVNVNDFNSFKEEILNAINDIKQTIAD